MNKLEKKLAALLLEIAAEEFCNHGCNDFELKRFVPDLKQRRQLVKEYHEWNGDPEEYDPEAKYEYFPDFALMSYLADKLIKTWNHSNRLTPPTLKPLDS